MTSKGLTSVDVSRSHLPPPTTHPGQALLAVPCGRLTDTDGSQGFEGKGSPVTMITGPLRGGGWLYHRDSGGSSSLGLACGTRVEKCGHKGNNPSHASGRLRSPVALQAERKLDLPRRSPQWFPRLWTGERRRVCPSLCCSGLCWMAHLDIELQQSAVSLTKSLGAGLRAPGLWSRCCLMGLKPPLREGGCGE